MADSGFHPLMRALRHRNYRLFFMGQSISLIGTWVQQVALSWYVYQITGSPWILGLVGFASQIPSFVVTPFAGVLVDHHNRHRILLLTQVLSMVQAFVLCYLFFNDWLSVTAVLVLSVILGVINALDIPARQSLVVELVDHREDLGNAIALNSSMVNAARLVGPSIAGLLIATVGEGVCFLLNALSYFAVIASLLMVKVKLHALNPQGIQIWSRLKEGVQYVRHHPPISAIIILLATVSLTGVPYMVLMPIFAKDVFHGDAHTLGFLIGFAGLGSLIGTTYLASREGLHGIGKMIAGSACLFGVGLMIFSFSSTLPVAFLAMFLAGFGMMVQFAACNTVLQTLVDDDKRGRVMSFYTMAFMGMSPIGSLIAGALAHRIGASWTLFGGGVCCVAISVWFAARLPMLRESAHKHLKEKIVVPVVPDA